MKSNFTNKTATTAILAITVVLGSASVLGFSLAQTAQAIPTPPPTSPPPTSTLNERLADALRTQADRLDARADQLEQQGANQAVVDALRDRVDALRDRADVLDPPTL